MVIRVSKLISSGEPAEKGTAAPSPDMPPVPLDDQPEPEPTVLPDEPSASRVPTRFRYTPGKLEQVRAKKRH